MIRSAFAASALLLLAACGGGGGGGGDGGNQNLPNAFVSLAPGFTAETVQGSLLSPSRFVRLPDGRIFFNELSTGNTRVIEADGTLSATILNHEDVLTGSHYGLLGIALDPNFAVNDQVFVVATLQGPPARMEVIRFTATGGVGANNRTVIVPNLPIGALNNSGDIVFENGGANFFLSVGDNDVSANAQSDLTPAGKIHRFTAAGGIPPTNPSPASSEWCRGIRNTFALAVHPSTGELYGADNGPTANDELNYHQAGKNFGWETLPPGFPAGQVGFRINLWPGIIVPTGLAWHTGAGAGWGASFANNLFMTTYSEMSLKRLALSGAGFTDLDSETTFATFRIGSANNPLCVRLEPDGNLLVSTFNAIYRIKPGS